MNTMSKRLSVPEAENLLKQLRVMYGDDLNLRLIVELPPEGSVSEVVPAIRSKGYAAHPESSSYADREVVVTGVKDGVA